MYHIQYAGREYIPPNWNVGNAFTCLFFNSLIMQALSKLKTYYVPRIEQ